MLADKYLSEAERLIRTIRTTQGDNIEKAAGLMAESIASRRAVYLFGSGHSVIPCLDIFPRYGSFVGFVPILDPRLMWFNVVGPGGAQELLWLERIEGYIHNVLLSYNLTAQDTALVFSHGGLNAAAIEVAMAAKEVGASVVAVTSMTNYRTQEPRHSSGKKLADVADVAIDNCIPPEDALVALEGRPERVAAGSTLSFTAISMALVAEVAEKLTARNAPLFIFVSANVAEIPAEHNQEVFREFHRFQKTL
jgi:uncharacterized phosphosugar-binding protein